MLCLRWSIDDAPLPTRLRDLHRRGCGKDRPTQPEAVDAYNKAASSRHSRTAAQKILQQLREHAQDPGKLKADRMQNWGREVDVTHAAEGLLGNDWVRESQFPIRSTKSGGGPHTREQMGSTDDGFEENSENTKLCRQRRRGGSGRNLGMKWSKLSTINKMCKNKLFINAATLMNPVNITLNETHQLHRTAYYMA